MNAIIYIIGGSMKRASKKDRRRLMLLITTFIILVTFFVANMFSTISKIYNNVKETKKLSNEYNEKISEEKRLKTEIEKLNDPEYVAKYAREKFLYSKNGEIIIKLK
jgi:cell division protein DivIC